MSEVATLSPHGDSSQSEVSRIYYLQQPYRDGMSCKQTQSHDRDLQSSWAVRFFFTSMDFTVARTSDFEGISPHGTSVSTLA